MTVSVVISTYNRAGMVRQAIQAALSQSRPPEEIVVMDDGSTDATAETLAELAGAHSRLRVFRRFQNSGGVEAWNDAAAQARGDCIAFCADDDRFLREHLEASAAYLEAHPDTGFVHSGFIDAVESLGDESFDERPFRSKTPLTTRRGDLISYMTRYYDWPLHPSTVVVRREVWEASGGFNPAYALTDTDWFMRVAEQTSGVLLPRHGVYNRRHAGNWSNRLGSARMQGEIFEIVEASISRLFERRPVGRTIWRAIWRANARLHLLMTARARVKSGHGNAACAAWRGMMRNTGRNAPVWLERAGENFIRWRCRGREPEIAKPLERFSPL
ncbi:MAG TPA: glycosyltransferase family 2 protein [Bryobacteraceae bacterium]|jgi:glycosyltransferase involved in cell wall biosynthesis